MMRALIAGRSGFIWDHPLREADGAKRAGREPRCHISDAVR
jgi:hypothetical protein